MKVIKVVVDGLPDGCRGCKLLREIYTGLNEHLTGTAYRCGVTNKLLYGDDWYEQISLFKGVRVKTFLICPVRGKDSNDLMWVVEKLEREGWDVHYPPRDTNQNDPTGLQICKDNVDAIRSSDVVHIYYDENSRGSLFDLGSAFGLGKPIVVVNIDDLEKTEGKSFINMIIDWQKNGLG
jgi:hypothetical protein